MVPRHADLSSTARPALLAPVLVLTVSLNSTPMLERQKEVDRNILCYTLGKELIKGAFFNCYRKDLDGQKSTKVKFA